MKVTVSGTVVPGHISPVTVVAIDAVGGVVFTVTACVAVAVQPFALVTVTV